MKKILTIALQNIFDLIGEYLTAGYIVTVGKPSGYRQYMKIGELAAAPSTQRGAAATRTHLIDMYKLRTCPDLFEGIGRLIIAICAGRS